MWRRLYGDVRAEGALAVAEIYRRTAATTVPAAAISTVMRDFLARIDRLNPA